MEKLSDTDKILGLTEPRAKTELELTAFTKETRYIVRAENNNNEKVVDGVFVGRILSLETKKQIMNGKITIKACGLEITRIEEPKEVIPETKTEELLKPKKKKRITND